MKLRPLGDRVLLERLEAEQTVNGIILPDSAKKKQETARVIAVGPGKKDKAGELIAPSVKEGDIVLMDKYAGQEVTIDGEEYSICRVGDIIAIIEE
ncbi:MAG: co-chaperone GroES [Waddliaceae bacterium]|nr:co-chaperone GroES [Waddliaceae bacterium]